MIDKSQTAFSSDSLLFELPGLDLDSFELVGTFAYNDIPTPPTQFVINGSLLYVTPEPSTALLVAFGLVGLAVGRRPRML